MSRLEQLSRAVLKPFVRNPRRPIPLAKIVPRMAAFRAELYREAIWDKMGVSRGPYSAWFLKRDAGLRAFAAYEVEIQLRRFSDPKTKTISADRYFEAELLVEIQEKQEKALSEHKPGVFDLNDVMKFKTQEDPEFFKRLGQWLYKGKDLDTSHADPRLQLYASLYDRAPVPLEFCSDTFAAGLIDTLTQSRDWRWPRKAADDEASAVDLAKRVRGWRRLLGLKLSMPPICRLGPDARPMPLNLHAARVHGLPFNPEDGSSWSRGSLARK